MRNYALHFIGQLESSHSLQSNLNLEDYLQRMALRIHPGYLFHHLSRPKQEASWHVHILVNGAQIAHAFPDGTLIFSTGWLTRHQTETQLMKGMTTLMAHVILDHAQDNFNAYEISSSFRFPIRQQQIARRYSESFLKQLKTPSQPDTTKQAYTGQIAPLLQLHAWQHYHQHEYAQALLILDRMINADAAWEETFFLKARIYRLLHDTEATNLQALGFLIRAEEIGVHPLIEIPAEKGLLYMRLGDYVSAKKEFETYLAAQLALDDNPEEQKWAREMLWRCVQRKKAVE